MKTTDAYRWTILGLGTFCILTFGVVFQSIPPLIGILVEALNISYARAGTLMGLFILPGIFLSIPGGMLTDRFGPRKVGIASLLSLTLGTAIVALSGSYGIIAFGRLVAGVGATVSIVVVAKIVASWFYDREIGLAMGIFNTSMPLGTILSLNFMGAIAFRFSWQASIWVSFAVGAAALFLFWVLCRSKSTAGELKSEPAGLLAAVKRAGGSAWLVGLSWGLFSAGNILIAGRASARVGDGFWIWHPGNGRRCWECIRPLYRRQFKGCDRRLPVEFRRDGHFSRHRDNTHVDT